MDFTNSMAVNCFVWHKFNEEILSRSIFSLRFFYCRCRFHCGEFDICIEYLIRICINSVFFSSDSPAVQFQFDNGVFFSPHSHMRCGDFSLFGMTVEEKTYSTNSFSPICESAQIACMNVVGMWTVNINQETIKFKFRIIIDVYPQTSHTHTDTLTQHFEMGNLIIYAKHFDFPFQAQKKAFRLLHTCHSSVFIVCVVLFTSSPRLQLNFKSTKCHL